MAKGKMKKKIKKAVNKVKQGVKKTVNKVKQGVKKTVNKVKDVASDAALIPLMLPMKAFLSLQKVKAKKDPTERAKQVYDIIQKGVGKGQLEGYEFDTDLTPLETLEAENVVGVVVAEVIGAVVAFFKGLADKKREGKITEGTPIASIADASIEAEDFIIRKAKETGQFEIGKFITNNILIIALVAVVGGYLLLKKR